MSVTDVDTPDAILTDLMDAVRHTGWSKPLWARQKPPSDAAILGHTDVNYRPSSWSRAKERWQLPPEIFKRIAALIDGPVAKRDLEERWYTLTDKWTNEILGDDVTLEMLLHLDLLERIHK